jgi:hypothetical protein
VYVHVNQQQHSTLTWKPCALKAMYTSPAPPSLLSCSVQARKRLSGLSQLSSCQVMSRGLHLDEIKRNETE